MRPSPPPGLRPPIPLRAIHRAILPAILPAIALTLLAGCGRNPEALARSGIESLNRDKPRKAVARLERAQKNWPDDSPPPHTALMHQALGLARHQRDPADPGVEDALRLAVDADPDAHDPAYNLGVWLLQHGDAETGRDLLERAAQLDPAQAEAPLALAQHALHEGDLSAAALWTSTARSRQETAPVLTAWAAARKNAAPIGLRRTALEDAVSLDPEYAPAHLHLAALLDRHRLEPLQAVSHYEAFTGLQPESPVAARVGQRIQVLQARVTSGLYTREDPIRLEVQAKLDEARDAARQGRPPLALRACLEANRIADRAERDDLQERALRAAATLAPDSPRGHYGLGRHLLARDRKSEALPPLLKARTLAPEWPPSLAPAVELAVELGRLDQARDTLQNAEDAARDNPGFLLQIVSLYDEVLNNSGEARRLRRLWLDRFPDHPRRAEVEARL